MNDSGRLFQRAGVRAGCRLARRELVAGRFVVHAAELADRFDQTLLGVRANFGGCLEVAAFPSPAVYAFTRAINC
jgi:hypothetical protein